MKILSIETSCDETAVAIVEARGDETKAEFKILGNALLSQVDVHQEFGGVFPALAKREHAKNLVPLLEAALEEAELLHEDTQSLAPELHDRIAKILEREPGLPEAFLEFISESETPDIDVIAVTAGPGLEPALWVGVNFAKALSLAWNKPVVAVNHLEGHILAALSQGDNETLIISDMNLPLLALLISGGHTELVLMKEWMEYELLGATRDDAVGEAFDKVARMLGLPYPGGPQISKLAEKARDENKTNPITLPRPMIDSGTCDFSFAGLKTAVLYLLKKMPDASDADKQHIAHEFENAVADVLWSKTDRALKESGARTLVIGGGVSANTHIRRVFQKQVKESHPEAALFIPSAELTTDNAVMIALAGFYRARHIEFADIETLRANGNLSLVRN
jgi:N6-L-threonylcarbamoyladenine synthase